MPTDYLGAALLLHMHAAQCQAFGLHPCTLDAWISMPVLRNVSMQTLSMQNGLLFRCGQEQALHVLECRLHVRVAGRK